MSTALLVGLGVAVLVVLILAAAAVHVLPEYERGVIFRLGRIQPLKGPGLIVIIPVVDRLTRVTLRTQTYDIPPQDIITRDNVTVRVNAVTYFNVVDAIRSVLSIDDYRFGTQQIAQTTLRSILGQTSLDDLLTKRDEVNQRLQQVIDSVTDPWGVKVTIVEVKDVILPEGMRRAMARQAESERDRRAKVIHALGEKEAAANLGEAAVVLEAHPAALQLRVLSTLLEVGSEHNSTIAFPIPMEFLRTLDPGRPFAAGNGQGTAPSATAAPATAPPPAVPAPAAPPPAAPPPAAPAPAASAPAASAPAAPTPAVPAPAVPPDLPPASAAA